MVLHIFLTPMLLAASPTMINLPGMIYDHAQQRTLAREGQQEAQQRTTYGGTQTYNFQGRPSDNDND